MRKLGVIGGTFDPPHYGHLILAEHARDELGLEQVLFVPAGTPPHKEIPHTPVKARLDMLRIITHDDPNFEISMVDVEREGPHYSLDMIRLIHEENPEATLYFIMGEDMFLTLPQWYRPQELFSREYLYVAVMQRVSGVQIRGNIHYELLPELEPRVHVLPAPLVEISSTDIRQRTANGKSTRYLLPDSVLAYMKKHNLYKDRT